MNLSLIFFTRIVPSTSVWIIVCFPSPLMALRHFSCRSESRMINRRWRKHAFHLFLTFLFSCVCRVPTPVEWSPTRISDISKPTHGGAMPLSRTGGVLAQSRRPILGLHRSPSPLRLLLPLIILLTSPLSSVCGALGMISNLSLYLPIYRLVNYLPNYPARCEKLIFNHILYSDNIFLNVLIPEIYWYTVLYGTIDRYSDSVKCEKLLF